MKAFLVLSQASWFLFPIKRINYAKYVCVITFVSYIYSFNGDIIFFVVNIDIAIGTNIKTVVKIDATTAVESPFKPQIGTNTLNAPDYANGNYINRIRTNLGLKWRLDSRSSVDFYYRFDVGTNRDINIDYKKDDVTIKAVYVTNERDYTHILGVAYTFDWK